jgi:dynein heavy chain, axonemal
VKKDAERITEDTEKPQFDDPERDPRDVLEELEEFVNQLTEYKDKSKSYQDYQEMFGRPVSDFGDLDDAISGINLRHKLFKSILEWNEKHKEWHDTAFTKIGAEDMNTEVQRYSKIVFQVQKGLPDSKVVPLFKRNVDEMKLSLPVITSLLNPDLKPRHWEAIQEILGPDVDLGEDVTLGSLLEMKVMESKCGLRLRL